MLSEDNELKRVSGQGIQQIRKIQQVTFRIYYRTSVCFKRLEMSLLYGGKSHNG